MLFERLKFLAKDTAVYGIANALSRAFLFFTLPVIIHSVTAAEFGYWNQLTIIGTILSAVTIFGMDSAVIRYFYDDSSHEHGQRIFSHGILIQLIMAALIGLASFSVSGWILMSFGLSVGFEEMLWPVLFWMPCNVIVQYFQNWFKWTFQRVKFMIMSLGLAALNLAILCFLQFNNELNLSKLLWVNTFSYFIFMILGVYWCRKYFRLEFNLKLFQKLLSFGFPMMLVMLVGIITPALDRIFLSHMLSDSQLGIYAFGQKLSIVMVVCVGAFQTAFGPFTYSIWEKTDAPITFAKFQHLYLFVMGIISISIISCSKILFSIFGDENYLSAINYYYILVLGSLVYGLYSFASIGVFYSKRMGLNLTALIWGLVAAGATNFILTPFLHETGAALGFLIGNLALIICGYIFSNRYYKIPFTFIKDIILLLVIAGLLWFGKIQLFDNILIDAGFKVIVYCFFFGTTVLALCTKEEREFIVRKVAGFMRIH